MATRSLRPMLCIPASILAAGALIAFAGPLDPPPGPVAPAYKTLTEVEPRIAINAANTPGDSDSVFRITLPGSYYLTGNLTGQAFKTCIEISCENVTLDLMGYTIGGVPNSLDGILAQTAAASGSVTVRNGNVRGFGGSGLSLGAFSNVGAVVEQIASRNNAGYGILTGEHAIVRNCTASDNGQQGIRASDGSTVQSCTATGNGHAGIAGGDQCVVTHCSSMENTSSGIWVEDSSSVTNCSAYNNGASGITTAGASIVTGCTAEANDSTGIFCTHTCLVADNVLVSNGTNGISFSNNSVVRGNNCRNNGTLGTGAGLFSASLSSRIENNKVSDNDYGLHLTSTNNFVHRNIASGNTTHNWNIVIGNHVAPIVSASTNGAQILGATYAGNLGSTDPNANFSY